jgi:hypothetical protein
MENFSTIFERAAKAEIKREPKVFKRNMRPECHIDGTAKSVMECIEGRVSDELYQDMMDYLLGFTDDMQLEIADNLLDAVCSGWEHYINIPHIDTKMKSFYLLIEEEMNHSSN